VVRRPDHHHALDGPHQSFPERRESRRRDSSGVDIPRVWGDE
jgi:hypothetical protein